ncbi:MAG: hypothetical protein JNM33_04180 [Rubrivivax sp.]|nr:hypothetical protein [Rubrivivax sp.]
MFKPIPLALALLGSVAASPAAFAMPSPNATARPDTPVEVLRASCPDLEARLDRTLARLALHAPPMLVKVQMRVDARQVREVELQGVAPEHRQPLRRALFGLECHSGGAESRWLSFNLELNNDLDALPAASASRTGS